MKPARSFANMVPEPDHKQINQLPDQDPEKFGKRGLIIREGSDAKDFVKACSWEQAPTDNINTACQRKTSASS